MVFAFVASILRGPSENIDAFPQEHPGLYTRLFWAWLMLRTLLWTAVSALSMWNPPMDTAEMLSWGQHWLWCYHKHPPMPAWIAEAATGLTGGSLWGVYFASHLVTGLCFWGVWRLGCEMLSPRAGFFAALCLEGLDYYNVMANDIGHGVALAGTSALTTLFFYWALRSGSMRWWAALGAAMGFTLLSKYSAGFLFLPMLLFLALHPACRMHWKQPGPYLAVGVAFLVCLPHVIACIQQDFGPFRYFLGRSTEKGHSWTNHLWYPLQFFLSQTWRLLPVVAILAPLLWFRWKLRRIAAHERFNRDFLLAIVVGPIVLHFLVALVLGVEVRDMWGHHLWTFIGLVALFFVETRDTPARFVWSGRLALGFVALFMVFILGKNLLGPTVGHATQTHFPGDTIARLVTQEWHQHHADPIPIVASDDLLLGCSVSWFVPGRPVNCMLEGRNETPWATDVDLNDRGGIIVWSAAVKGDNLPPEFLSRFPGAKQMPPILALRHAGPNLPPLRVGVAFVSPRRQSLSDSSEQSNAIGK